MSKFSQKEQILFAKRLGFFNEGRRADFRKPAVVEKTNKI